MYVCMYVNQTKCVCARVVDAGTWRCRIFLANDDLVAAKQNSCDHEINEPCLVLSRTFCMQSTHQDCSDDDNDLDQV